MKQETCQESIRRGAPTLRAAVVDGVRRMPEVSRYDHRTRLYDRQKRYARKGRLRTVSCRLRREQVQRIDEIAAACGVTRYRIVEALCLRFLDVYDHDAFYGAAMRSAFF